MELKAQMNIKQTVPFFWVTNMEVTIEFYVKGLGFRMTNQWINEGKLRWCWLENEGAALMLQELSEQQSNVSKENSGEGIHIYFMCEDALKIYKELTSRGLSASEPFVGNNMWVVELKDPDGYKIFFESSTAVPEGTKYSDWIETN